MHKLLPILLLLLPLAADICVAQTSPLNIVCADCRDPNHYPDDFVNFAFNQAYGPDAWLPFWPTNLLQVTLALPNGNIYTVLRSIFLTPLPVPASDDGDMSGGGGGSEGEDEDDDNYDDNGGDEPENDDYEGTTGIEDPDENGDFGDTEWC